MQRHPSWVTHEAISRRPRGAALHCCSGLAAKSTRRSSVVSKSTELDQASKRAVAAHRTL